MAKNTVWQDDYWLPVMQLYLHRPAGVKPTYSRDMVALSLELHIAPQILAERMKQVAMLSTPRIERIWQAYSGNPRRLSRAVRLWREMRGFGQADVFYEGVQTVETFERDFRPLPEYDSLTPVALILVLDLYFRLTPATMVEQTPEVADLARLLKVPAATVVQVLETFQLCDPYLRREVPTATTLLDTCREVWQRFGNGDTEKLATFAEELKEYYR